MQAVAGAAILPNMTPTRSHPRNFHDRLEHARALDILLEHDPGFQAAVARFSRQAAAHELPADSTVVSLALDSGQFSLAAARLFPQCTIVHAGAGGYMADLVNIKRRRAQLDNLVVMNRGMDEITLRLLRDIQAVIYVDVLSAYRPAQHALANAIASMRHGGKAFLCEYRCAPNDRDWHWYLLEQNRARLGWRGALKMLLQGRSVLAQVRRSPGIATGMYMAGLEADAEAAGLTPTASEVIDRGVERFVTGVKALGSIDAAAYAEESRAA